MSTPDDLLQNLRAVLDARGDSVRAEWHRTLAFGDYVSDRWAKARALGWGDGSSVYDSCLVIGDVAVGAGVWVGPYTLLDGSGGLTVGDGCTVAAGVHVYTHDNIAQTVTGGAAPIARAPVTIGDRTYLGPNAVVTKGVTIGSGCVVGAGALVTRSLPDGALAVGTPARVVARVVVDGAEVRFDYDDPPAPGAEP
jgi:carbonic anhydrase/acetyltransferase-like protein (isoleucine patch superfamily)